MRWSSLLPSSAVMIPQHLATRHLPSYGAVCLYHSSRAPPLGAAAAAQCRSRSLQRGCARLWTGPAAAGPSFPAQLATPSRCSKNGDGEVGQVEDVHKLAGEATGAEGRDGDEDGKGTFSSKELMGQLKRYGVAGVLSYGLLNTFYYLVTFLLVWFYFAPAPGKMGYAAAVKRFIKVMAAVWAGSQVTKLLRAGGALALAPFVDKGLSRFTVKFKFESKGKAFAAIAGACFGLAFLLFLVLTLLWA